MGDIKFLSKIKYFPDRPTRLSGPYVTGTKQLFCHGLRVFFLKKTQILISWYILKTSGHACKHIPVNLSDTPPPPHWYAWTNHYTTQWTSFLYVVGVLKTWVLSKTRYTQSTGKELHVAADKLPKLPGNDITVNLSIATHPDSSLPAT